MPNDPSLASRLHDEELKLLAALRAARRKARGPVDPASLMTTGQRIADGVAALVGSWGFIIVQSSVLIAWMAPT
jgi:uncharacterized membrane protein